ncbi:MAG: hypothetical protein KDE19_18475, partial [Caldilineaceae bacterium]|nr:hypothetical protein [Caldilineaceae bacterium]
MKLLVITPVEADPNCQAITLLLDQIGIPYDVLIATENQLMQEQLWHGSQARYQGIILATGNLLYWSEAEACWKSALSLASWQLLWAYEIRFGIRQLALYAIGGSPEDYGVQLGAMQATDVTSLPVYLTEAGRALFPYLNAEHPILVQFVPVYPAQSATPNTIPLLLTKGGDTVAALSITEDGRETLAVTFAHTTTALHTHLLGYGLINWVTRGLFVGERHIYLNVQVDDIFNRNTLWDTTTGTTGKAIYRMRASDAETVVRWLARVKSQMPNCETLTLDFAFNCAGIPGYVSDPTAATRDPLSQVLLHYQRHFRWINHGYTHLLLDQATYAESTAEILQNHQAALALGLERYHPTDMVTAVVSGLGNPEFLRAARDAGIRRLVSDTSNPEWDNAAPNTGIINPLQPEILCIPRRPTNLFFDVSTPAEWESKYNAIYYAYWQRDLSVDEIVVQEGEMILRYLLRFDSNPLMFHQANLRAYNEQASLLTDLLDYVLARYHEFYGAVPIRCLSMEGIGTLMSRRALLNTTKVDATLVIGKGLSLCADQAVTVPVTGAYINGECEVYAGQWISQIALQDEERW